MSEGLVFALPSKGRLHEQAAGWLADSELTVKRADGERGYAASLSGASDVTVRLMAAREIALGLDSGDLHLGVTGEDLLQEESGDPDQRLFIMRRLGFGKADVVVAAPQSWLDVAGMHDLEEVSAQERARRSRQLRVATKYPRLTRRFFARHGLVDYRTVASHGATEGAPAMGVADLIVDITTTGATLSANHLKPLADGVILRSQAVLCASAAANWTPSARAALAQLLDVLEARARALGLALLRCGPPAPEGARDAAAAAAAHGAWPAPSGDGWVCARAQAATLARALRDATGSDVIITPMSYDFAPQAEVFAQFESWLAGAPAAAPSA